MGCVHLNEPEKTSFNGPFARQALLNPVASHCKVSIGVAGLPCIAYEADVAFDSGALTQWRCHNGVSVNRNGNNEKR